jgi:hypothetical protein
MNAQRNRNLQETQQHHGEAEERGRSPDEPGAVGILAAAQIARYEVNQQRPREEREDCLLRR